MASFVVSYDLKKPGRNYDDLYDAIKEISGNWAHVMDSTWVVTSDKENSSSIRDKLNKAMDSNDVLFVAKLTGETAWAGLSEKLSGWLKENL